MNDPMKSPADSTAPCPTAPRSPASYEPGINVLFQQSDDGHFTNLAAELADWSKPRISRGLAIADFDRDGDQDMAIADLYDGVRLIRNDMALGHAINLNLRSLNAQGLPTGRGEGFVAIAWVDGVPLRRSVTGASYLSQNTTTLHWGLGNRTSVDRLEIRWHAGPTNVVENLQADTTWEWTEGQPEPRQAHSPARTPTLPTPANTADTKARTIEFWRLHRAGMDAIKRDNDPIHAIPLFRGALQLNPQHEDARYYLAHCLTVTGATEQALQELRTLQQINPQSHRAWQRWGTLRGSTATNTIQLIEAETALQRAHDLNHEETGALLVLGEVSLLLSDPTTAAQRLTAVCQANPKAAPAYFLRAFLSWSNRDETSAITLLQQAREALGPDWQPPGDTSEGDLQGAKQHSEETLLSPLWKAWYGTTNPAQALTPLQQFIQQKTRSR